MWMWSGGQIMQDVLYIGLSMPMLAVNRGTATIKLGLEASSGFVMKGEL
jgi:hypothetical protein